MKSITNTNKKLENINDTWSGAILNFLALFELLIGTGLSIASIWFHKEWIGIVLIVVLLMFLSNVIIYWKLFYDEDDMKKC